MKTNLFPDVCEESPARRSLRTPPRLSRRNFLRYTGLGTAGTTLILSRSLDAFAADIQTSDQGAAETPIAGTAAPGSELGEVTLDGLMITYFSVPPAFSSSIFTFGKNFSTAFTLKLPKSPGIPLRGMAPASHVLTANHTQHTSSWVKDAIVLRSVSEGDASDKKERFSIQEASGPLQIYGFRNPKLQFSGTPDSQQFYFSDAGQRSFNLGRQVGAETSASMYSQYVTDPAQLFPPRFYWLDVLGSGGETTVDVALPSRLMVRNGITTTATARIIDQTGFRSQQLQEAFAIGNELEITYHSTQEFPSASLMELQTTPPQSGARIYIDRIFKTFVMTQKGNGA